MGTNKVNGPGKAARNVAANLRRLRDARGLSTTALERMLGERDRPIHSSAITRIEHCQRGVDVDDLVVLADIFDVSPTALLEPFECPTCEGEPPSGFVCRMCGAEG